MLATILIELLTASAVLMLTGWVVEAFGSGIDRVHRLAQGPGRRDDLARTVNGLQHRPW